MKRPRQTKWRSRSLILASRQNQWYCGPAGCACNPSLLEYAAGHAVLRQPAFPGAQGNARGVRPSPTESQSCSKVLRCRGLGSKCCERLSSTLPCLALRAWVGFIKVCIQLHKLHLASELNTACQVNVARLAAQSSKSSHDVRTSSLVKSVKCKLPSGVGGHAGRPAAAGRRGQGSRRAQGDLGQFVWS